jgi:uncharacterized protein (TIGR03086 family)
VTSAADRFRDLSDRFTALIDAVPDSRWASPSPCAEWNAADIVDHVVTTEADLLGRMPFAPEPPLDLGSPRRAWPAVRDHVQLALDTPEHAGHAYDGYFGPTTFADTVDQFYNFDLVVHCWDLARATGLAEFEPIDPAEIERLTISMSALGDNMRGPGVIGPALDVGDGADPQTTFLAFLGRRA